MVFLMFACPWVFLLGVMCFSCGFSFCSSFMWMVSLILLSLDLNTSCTQICIYVWTFVGDFFLLYFIYNIYICH